MNSTDTTTAMTDRITAMLLHHDVEQFLYREAAILDAHDYDSWLDLLHDDIVYFMPIRRTRMSRDTEREFTKPVGEMAWFKDTKPLLAGRVAKLASGRSWAEDPPSRTRHLVTNVVVVVSDDGTDIGVHSNFHLYRTRLRSEETSWIGSRQDVLRRVGDGFQVLSRTILLEQTILLSRNLSNFF